ncbi:NAD-dependent epimerase/dehydratase family protein [Variovorax sp. PAMC28562]|uniref:NAD-dependent epimerase/dehydratase family protein n=1 Tax=Variovorax sp. PAMC28562 TaxID=2762323 RepID=UPI00164DF8D1|nr:NAD-dependent epimerase/dehydratase family protein [Variovorax sp. PAMC28562]QNK75208.1 NAD-dependent epimerase/dehydratase family protein [Variovorax sp. PAMC28562]
MNLVLGATGRLGSALCGALASFGVLAPSRQVYSDWWRADASATIREYLRKQSPRIAVIHIAAGIIDPSASGEAHGRINLEMPLRILDAASSLGIRVITFGTVLETLGNIEVGTGYVASKAALGREVTARSQHGVDALHIRLHTLYGGDAPTPFMFLGQMLSALRAAQPFEMSSGTQLREYHHVDDEGPAIRTLAAAPVKGCLLLSHGDPLTLAELAQHCFQRFGHSSLLRIGAVPAPLRDNFATRFARTPQLERHSFRDARAAVPEYLKTHIAPETPQ